MVDFQLFHPFRRLPLELQFKVWKESVDQTPRRVYELYDHEPNLPSIPRLAGEEGLDKSERRIMIAEIKLDLRSVKFERPLLGVDKTSRQENLRHYRHVKFHNAHIYMNMGNDAIYLGNLSRESLQHMFRGKKLGPQEPFWREVQHLAFGMAEVEAMLEFEEDVQDHSWCLRELQQFSSLRTFTLVLDGIPTEDEWPPNISIEGSVIFRKATAIRGKKGKQYDTEWLNEWMDFFKEMFYTAGARKPEWKVPCFLIKSLSRGGRLQFPDWNDYPAVALIDRLHGEIDRLDSIAEDEYHNRIMNFDYDYHSDNDSLYCATNEMLATGAIAAHAALLQGVLDDTDLGLD